MKIVMISDTHEQWYHVHIPPCDLLISAGDYSYRGYPNVVEDFHAWLHDQPAKNIISVQGNHEVWVEQLEDEALKIAKRVCPRINFLSEGALEMEGIKIYCSAATPQFYNWAYMIDRGEPMREHWAKIPADTELLVTHGPPYGILDTSPRGIARANPTEHLGCEELAKRLPALKNLRLHVFGHIHGSSGVQQGSVTFVNAAICDESYKPTNRARTYEW